MTALSLEAIKSSFTKQKSFHTKLKEKTKSSSLQKEAFTDCKKQNAHGDSSETVINSHVRSINDTFLDMLYIFGNLNKAEKKKI